MSGRHTIHAELFFLRQPKPFVIPPSLLALGPFERTTKSRKSHGALTVPGTPEDRDEVAVHCSLSAMRHAPGSTPVCEIGKTPACRPNYFLQLVVG